MRIWSGKVVLNSQLRYANQVNIGSIQAMISSSNGSQ
mgnify:FL=1